MENNLKFASLAAAALGLAGIGDDFIVDLRPACGRHTGGDRMAHVRDHPPRKNRMIPEKSRPLNCSTNPSIKPPGAVGVLACKKTRISLFRSEIRVSLA